MIADFSIGNTSISLNLEEYGITYSQADGYFHSLWTHIANVQSAGRKLGLSNDQLDQHDLSKMTIEEFPYYVRQFFGDKADPDGFAMAWLHHLHANKHHHEHWRFSDGYSPKGSTVENGCVFMPNHYALEMIADWIGASISYTGSDDMTDWLWKNMPRIHVHSRTAAFLRQELDQLGYADVVYSRRFGHEKE